MADHWVRVVQKLPSPASRLHSRHAANEPWWPQVIDDYWSGRLGGLERVPSSKFAEVDRGSVGPEPRVVYFKRFLRRGSFDSFKHLVRASRAARAFAGIRLFSDAGFSSTCVSCIVEARRLGVVRESCLVTEELPDAPSLTHWLFDDSIGHDAGAFFVSWEPRSARFTLPGSTMVICGTATSCVARTVRVGDSRGSISSAPPPTPGYRSSVASTISPS